MNICTAWRISKKQRNWNKAALTYLASRTSDADVSEEMKIFFTLDKNRDGYITLKELKEGMKDLDNVNELTEILKGVDIDNNGAINYTEFIAATLNQNTLVNEKTKIKDAFRVFDKDGDGNIDEDELKQALESSDSNMLKEMIKECDADGDGKIDFAEFASMMTSND